MRREFAIEASRAAAMLAAMVGEYAWWSRTGDDAILRMDFGAPRLRVREPSPNADRHTGDVRTVLERRLVIPTGRWHLFIEGGDWRVGIRGVVCDRRDAESADAARQAHVVKCLSLLDGQKLTDAGWSAERREWHFAFDLGGLVSIGNEEEPEGFDEIWTIFHDDGTDLSWMRDQSFSFGEGTSRG